MSKRNRKIELLAPAGNFEKLEIAIHYGADAVYLAGKEFSLRNFSGNFTLDELHKAVKFACNCGVKTYVACNIYSRNPAQKAIEDYLKALGKISPDAVIIADPGILMEAGKIIPQIPLHLSTQANTTNYKTVMFWEKFGIKRINVARELSLKEIKEIVSRSSIEIEAFAHGSMCISYSGRCLLSAFMTNRSSNLGECSHPCRWNYAVMEEKRPGQYYPIAENKKGTYIFNSRDLCMIEHIPEIIESGLSSIKIEGRMKGINYVASAVKVYREAIDSYYENPDGFKIQKYWLDELNNISHRGYCTGFYFGDPEQISPNFEYNLNPGLLFVGKIIETSGPQNVNIDVRNKIFTGDAVEVLTIKGPSRKDRIKQIIDQNGKPLSFAQPGSRVTIFLNSDYLPNDLIRRACDDLKKAEGGRLKVEVMKGYVHVYTGDGKGKTTATLGLSIRAAGAGLKVFIAQFLKRGNYSEIKALKRFSDLITVEQFGTGRLLKGKPNPEDIERAQKGIEKVKSIVSSGNYKMVILDEANVAVKLGLFPAEDLLYIIANKPEEVEIVITGRDADQRLIEKSDLVTEMKEIKHYFQKGVKARVGIEK